MNSFDLRGYLSNNPLLNEATDPKAEQVIKTVMRRYGRTRKEAVEDLTDMGVLSGYGDYQFVPKTKFKGSSDEYTETVEDKIASYYRNNDIEVVDASQDIPDIKADFEIEDEEDTPPQEEPEEEPLQGPEGDVSDFEDTDPVDNYDEFDNEKLDDETRKELVKDLTDAIYAQDTTMGIEFAEQSAEEFIDELGEQEAIMYLDVITNPEELIDASSAEESEDLEQARDSIQDMQQQLEQAKEDLASLRAEKLDSIPGGSDLADAMENSLDTLTGAGSSADGDGGDFLGAKADGTGGTGDGGFGFPELDIPLWVYMLMIFLFGRFTKRRNTNESVIEKLVRHRLDEERTGSNFFNSLRTKWKTFSQKFKGRSNTAGAESILAFIESLKAGNPATKAAIEAMKALGSGVKNK